MKPKLIIFDLNKTLIYENSWLDLNMAMGVTQAEDQMLLDWSHEGVVDDVVGQNILCEIYKKRGDISHQAIWKVVSAYTYLPGAKETVAKLIADGYQIALVSGAMDILVQSVAKELGVHHWRAANQFIFDEDNKLARIESVPNDVAHKVEMLNEICQELNIEPKECAAIGDGDNDIGLFELTGHGVTFADSKIVASAEHVINSLPDLLDIY
jgi:phosphoserine phosphatase